MAELLSNWKKETIDSVAASRVAEPYQPTAAEMDKPLACSRQQPKPDLIKTHRQLLHDTGPLSRHRLATAHGGLSLGVALLAASLLAHGRGLREGLSLGVALLGNCL